MSLYNKLQNVLNEYLYINNKKPNIIVMHPNTWENLLKELKTEFLFLGNTFNMFTTEDPHLKYEGIRLLRSFDLKEGEFKM